MGAGVCGGWACVGVGMMRFAACFSSSMPVSSHVAIRCTCSKGRTVAYYLQRELFELASNDDRDLLVAPENEDELTTLR